MKVFVDDITLILNEFKKHVTSFNTVGKKKNNNNDNNKSKRKQKRRKKPNLWNTEYNLHIVME